MVLRERIKWNWHWLLKDGVSGSPVSNLECGYCLKEISLSRIEKYFLPTLWTSQIRARPECQGGKAKRPCRKKAQISGDSWFVSEELEASKASLCAPGTGGANMSILCVMGFQQCVPAVSCSSVTEWGWVFSWRSFDSKASFWS